jgi:hypothetical protein
MVILFQEVAGYIAENQIINHMEDNGLNKHDLQNPAVLVEE